MRALHPHRAARRARLAGEGSTADAVRLVADHDGPWAALGTGWPPSAMAAWSCARAWRTWPTTRRASCGWPARRTGRPARRGSASRPGRGRPRSCSGASAPSRPAGSSRACRSSPSAGVNLTRIESRPRKQGLGRYMFFADMEGREDDAPVAEAVGGSARPRGAPEGAGLLSRSVIRARVPTGGPTGPGRRPRVPPAAPVPPRQLGSSATSEHQSQRPRHPSTCGAGGPLAGCSY